MNDMSLRPRPGESADDVLARVTAEVKKRQALPEPLLEILDLCEADPEHGYTAREFAEVIAGMIRRSMGEESAS